MSMMHILPKFTSMLLISGSSSHAFRSSISPIRQLTTLSMTSSSSSLVTIKQAIEAHKSNNSNNKFIDGSWFMPGTRNGRSEYISGPRIPGALYLDIDDVSPQPGSADNPNSLPHMKPSSKLFACTMDRMGITPDDTLYVYGTPGCGFNHRAYWTLSSTGYHDPSKVKLIQGSLDEWKECGSELEYGELKDDDTRLFKMSDINDYENASPKYTCFQNDASSVVDMEQVLQVVEDDSSSDTIIVDARSAGRFYGKDPEPREGLRSGHMPNAINVPFISLLDSSDMTKFKPMEEVREIFVNAGIKPLVKGDDNVPTKVICSCGSGVTAAALAVGLEECGLREKEDIVIYDGSWIEYGGNQETPIVTD